MGQTASISARAHVEQVSNRIPKQTAQNAGGSAGSGDTVNGSTGTVSSHKRSDLRWSRISMSQLYDETFLAKEFKRFETLSSSSCTKQIDGQTTTRLGAAKQGKALGQNSLKLHLLTRKATMKARKDQEENLLDNPANAAASDVNDLSLWSFDDPNNASNYSDEEKQQLEIQREQELLNRLFLLSDLSQPQIVMLMVTRLRQQIAVNCHVSNAFDEFLKFRQLLLCKVMDSMQLLQENHVVHLRNITTMNQIAQETSRSSSSCTMVKSNGSCFGARGPTTTKDSAISSCTATSNATNAGFLKPKDKAAREATLGVNVLLWMLETLLNEQVATSQHMKVVLLEMAPLIQQLTPLALLAKSMKSNSCLPSKPFHLMASQRSTHSTANTNLLVQHHPHEACESLDSLQRFLVECCAVFGSSPTDLEEKTLAMNCFLYLAAARGSLRDFLMAIKVLLMSEPNPPVHVHAAAESVECEDEEVMINRIAGNALAMKERLLDEAPQEIDEGIAEAIRFTDGGDPSTADHLQQKFRVLLDEAGELREQTNAREASFTTKKKPPVKSAKQQQQQEQMQQLQQQQQQQQQPHYQVSFALPLSKKDDLQTPTTLASLSTDLSEDSAQFSRRHNTIPKLTPSPLFKPLQAVSILKELNECRAVCNSGAPGSSGYPRGAGTSTSSSGLRPSGSRSIYSDCWSTAVNLSEDDEEEPEVWSCGQNSYGELGHGDTTTRKVFERVETLLHKDIVQICAGNEHTIALSSDGQVYTCGYNDNGQCGLGVSTRISQMTGLTRLPNDQVVSQIHAYNGCEHTILVTQDGRAATFGYNYRGQLGHGNTTSEFLPKFLRGFETKRVLLVSCSYYHTIMSVNEGNGAKQSVYSFGRNDYGQLGHNDTLDRKFPQLIEWFNQPGDGIGSGTVNGNSSGGGNGDGFGCQIVSLACGQYHSMVVTSSGQVIGFGKNDYGQLGLETLENQLIPVQIKGNGLEKLVAVEIRCGYYHTIVLCTGSHLYGFGRNDYGQLGLGKPNATASSNLQMQQQRFSTPQLIEELENKEIARFACGCYHTIAVSENGMLFVFGRNNHGQLGTNDTVERTYPFCIDTFMGKHIVMVAAGFYHTMVLTGGKQEEPTEATISSESDGVEAARTSVEVSTSFRVVLEDPYFQHALGILPPTPANTQSQKQQGGRSIEDIDADREEDEERRRNGCGHPKVSAEISTPTVVQPTSVSSVDAAILLLAQLDRLSRPFTPKRGTYPSLQNASPQAMQSLLNSKQKVDFAESIEGCFQPYTIQISRGTFDTLLLLVQQLGAKRLGAFDKTKRTTSNMTNESPRVSMQVYALCACLKILQANVVQLLRSGLGQIVLIVGIQTPRGGVGSNSNPNLHEIYDIACALAKIRDELMLLLSKPKGSLCGGELSEEYERKVMEETMETLMLGLELYFPCKCSQAQLLFSLLDMKPTPIASEPSPTKCTRCSGGSTKISPRNRRWEVLGSRKKTFVDFLLRRLAEDSLLTKYIPVEHGLPDGSTPDQLVMSGANSSNKLKGSMHYAKQIYCALLEKISHDTGFAMEDWTKNTTTKSFRNDPIVPPLSKDLKKASSWSKAKASPNNSDFIPHAMVSVLIGIQKHLASWALQTKRWNLEFGEIKYDQGAWLQQLVQNVFSVTPQSHSTRVPLAWKCFLEFCIEILSQSVALLMQIQSKQMDRLATNCVWMDFLELSVISKLLPSLVACLMLFTELPLFVITLLPFVKELARILQLLNDQHEQILRQIEQEFFHKGMNGVENGSNKATTLVSGSLTSKTSGNGLLGDASAGSLQAGTVPGKSDSTLVTDSCSLPWNFRLQKELVILATKMSMTLISGEALFDWSEDWHSHHDLSGMPRISLRANPHCVRWLEKSRLFHGGLLPQVLREALNNPSVAASSSPASSIARIVHHMPLTTDVQVKLLSSFALRGITWNGIERDFFVILPPPACGASTTASDHEPVVINDQRTIASARLNNNHEQNPIQAAVAVCSVDSLESYLRMINVAELRTFLLCMTGTIVTETMDEASKTSSISWCLLYTKAQTFCNWIREAYAKTDASYRMVLRQLTQKSKTQPSIMSTTNSSSVVVEFQMENAVFASLLYHEGLSIPTVTHG